MRTGVCYFPEHWPRERWADDVERMAAAGIDYVRMAEFAWSRLEPEPGAYDFEWLADAVDLVGDSGMRAVLCTPTATPPKWLLDEYPSVRQERPDGTPLEFGSRRHYCFNSPAYRRESRRITERTAERFANSPHVAGWQTDNEFGCHDTVRCYCDDCASAFRAWLRDRYDTIDALNEAWGNVFWSQEYADFHEVDPPGPTPAYHHPSRLLDYSRFASDSVVDYNRLQVDLLREANDDWFVTHNFMGDFEQLDAFEVSADLDFAAWDSYPTLHGQRAPDTPDPADATAATVQRVGDPDVTGMNHALFRGASGGPFWVMENQAGDVRAYPYSAEPADGMMRLWAHQAAAHGADVVSYFRWRRCRFGQEQYWGALNNYDGSPDRGLPEAAEAAAEFARLPDLDAPVGNVAVLFDYDSMWALHAERHAPEFDYWAHLRTYYRALRRRGVTVDFVPADADLDGYAAAVAPALHLVPDDLAARLADYVTDGGELLLTVRSATKDEHDTLRDELAPGPLTDVVGARVEQHESLSPGLETRVEFDGDAYGYRTWAEWLVTDGATVVGHHRSDVAAGNPAVVRNAHGDGHATYVGVWPEADLADALTVDVLDRADVPICDRLPEDVRLSERDGHTWVTNFRTDAVSVDPGSNEIVLGEDTVPGRDLAVVAGPSHAITVERS
ncbi:beta-galactosidase [Halegenticoccus tardaugens]|uniref:beta-galactosidase n=1 Tax=Halegenticoccus tardaugens TaxID=2071624 RepID=UPI00100AC47F|nr:beta-galactosidase [Halegenticoccus tardaugens]